jgi:elongation factor Ts
MIELIKELRARTSLGMNECKKALEETNGDLEKAIEFLQKKGLKKVDDLVIPMEGIVKAGVLDSILSKDYPSKAGFIVEINCQTDFGANSEIFQKFVNKYIQNPNLAPNLYLDLTLVSNQLGEKVVIRRFESWENISASGNTTFPVFTTYNHLGDKIAVLMKSFIIPGKENNPEVIETLNNIAMQIAAMKPLAIDRDSLPKEMIEKKNAFYQDEVKFKPGPMINKIVTAKMNRWYSEVCLLEQDAIFSDETPQQTVQSHLDKLGEGVVRIARFVRYERGEKIEPTL